MGVGGHPDPYVAPERVGSVEAGATKGFAVAAHASDIKLHGKILDK